MPDRGPKHKKNPYAKILAAYYQTLKDFQFQNALHEGAASVAFQTLLADAARSYHWTREQFSLSCSVCVGCKRVGR